MDLALSIPEPLRNLAKSGFSDHRSPGKVSPIQSPVLLDLLPFTPLSTRDSQLQLSLPPDNGNNSESRSSSHIPSFDVNQIHSDPGGDEAMASSPNSHVINGKRDWKNGTETEWASSKCSDEEGLISRKKLRLSKHQSASLEESFKQHSTLNPKQKHALAKLLDLRPRQVEVWFQNRRARTKSKQTEVDCEYLKSCCKSLTEENRRLQKQVQELVAMKTSHSLDMRMPATTLTMCSSCKCICPMENVRIKMGREHQNPMHPSFCSKPQRLHEDGFH